MKLRPYQESAIEGCRAEYRAGRRAVLLNLPTGAGKTVCAAAIILAALARGNEALFLAHRKELISQSVAKLAEAGVTDVRVIRAEHDEGRPDAPVTVASIPTLTTPRWADKLPRAGLVILDEAHHAKARSWERLAGSYASARILGLSATPQRSDGAALGDLFEAIVVGATVRELMELGHLVRCRVWSPPTLLESGKLALTPLEAYRAHAGGQRAIVFCTRTEDAERYAAELTAGGVPAAAVHSKLSEGRRDDVLARFRAGELRAAVNVGVLTEGTDIPEAAVCILARAPEHAGLFLQMVGRVLRPAPWADKREAVLVDLCGSVLVHGTPDMDRRFTLDGKGISGVDRLAIRQCGVCGGVFEAARATRGRCPLDGCGAELPVRPRKAPRSSGAGVEEVTDLSRRRADTLRANLEIAARYGRRSADWVERAHAAISKDRLPWR